MTKNGLLEPPTKIKNFPSFIIFDQTAWATVHEIDQNLCFWKKKNVFEKFENWWLLTRNSLTITKRAPKYDEKIRKFSQKALWYCRAIVHSCSSSLQCGKKKKLTHMEAQKSKSHYKSSAKSTDISGSYRAV